jgi:hypothetical protein
MRPDADSDSAGAESEYGNDTGFAAEATRVTDPEVNSAAGEDESAAGEAGGTTGGPGDGGD